VEKEVKLLSVQPGVTYIQNWALTIMSQAKRRSEQDLGIIIAREAFFFICKKVAWIQNKAQYLFQLLVCYNGASSPIIR